jgi:carbonic anhydrase
MPETATDQLLRNARAHEAEFSEMPAHVPERGVAIVTCMDCRIDNFAIFGLGRGEAHIIRNAGGLVTEDVLRSLVISQRVLHTREVVLVHHTECGLLNADEAAMRARIRAETGAEPPYAFGAFSNLDDAVRRAMQRVREHPFLPHRDRVRGFVYNVRSGGLREID